MEPKEARDIRIPLPLDLHRAVKKCAADHDETMQNIVIAALWAFVGGIERKDSPDLAQIMNAADKDDPAWSSRDYGSAVIAE